MISDTGRNTSQASSGQPVMAPPSDVANLDAACSDLSLVAAGRSFPPLATVTEEDRN